MIRNHPRPFKVISPDTVISDKMWEDARTRSRWPHIWADHSANNTDFGDLPPNVPRVLPAVARNIAKRHPPLRPLPQPDTEGILTMLLLQCVLLLRKVTLVVGVMAALFIIAYSLAAPQRFDLRRLPPVHQINAESIRKLT